MHAGLDPDPAFGGVVPPIHQASTYVQKAPGEFVGDYDYSRSANPTRTQLEKALGELEGGRGTAFSSGMAGTHALITAVCTAGAHAIIPSDLYGGTYRLVDKVLSRWGLEYTMVDQSDLDAVAAAVRPETKLIWVETPTNPSLNVVDVEGIVARKGGAFVAVDNTFATPVYQRPLELGADAVVHSTTKYLGGHSDTVGGAVVVRDARAHEGMKFVQNSVGAVPGPFDCFLVHRGLRTLHLRMAAHTENARAVTEWLREAPGVSDVRWPGFAGMVCFRHDDATGIASRTEVFALAESLGGVESLLEVPQAMTHQSVEDSDAAVPADLVRLSCGIEDPADLVADLAQAMGLPVRPPDSSAPPRRPMPSGDDPSPPAARAAPARPRRAPPPRWCASPRSPSRSPATPPTGCCRCRSRTRLRRRPQVHAEGVAARDARAPAVAGGQQPRRVLGLLPLREVGQGAGVAARREPRDRLAPRRLRARRRARRREADPAAARARRGRRAAGARAPDGRRGADLGLRVLGRRDDAVHGVPPLLRQARQAQAQGEQDASRTATTSTSA